MFSSWVIILMGFFFGLAVIYFQAKRYNFLLEAFFDNLAISSFLGLIVGRAHFVLRHKDLFSSIINVFLFAYIPGISPDFTLLIFFVSFFFFSKKITQDWSKKIGWLSLDAVIPGLLIFHLALKLAFFDFSVSNSIYALSLIMAFFLILLVEKLEIRGRWGKAFAGQFLLLYLFLILFWDLTLDFFNLSVIKWLNLVLLILIALVYYLKIEIKVNLYAKNAYKTVRTYLKALKERRQKNPGRT